jgi:hypothetical protein
VGEPPTREEKRVEPSEAGRLLQKMVELEMRERGERDPRQIVGERITVSGEAAAAAGIPMGAEYDAVVSSSLGRLVAGGQLIYDPEQSERIGPIVGEDFGAYVVTAWGIQWLLGLGMLD